MRLAREVMKEVNNTVNVINCTKTVFIVRPILQSRFLKKKVGNMGADGIRH